MERGVRGNSLLTNGRYTANLARMRFGNLLVMCQFGTLPADLTRANMERFAKGVMPKLKALA